MPANGRWDLIRRLKVNLRSSQVRKRGENWFQPVLITHTLLSPILTPFYFFNLPTLQLFFVIKNIWGGVASPLKTAVGNRYADHVTPLYPQKLALTSPTGGGRSVGIVSSRTNATEVCFLVAFPLSPAKFRL